MNTNAETLPELMMVRNDDQKLKYILIVGLGVTGLSVVRFLYKQNIKFIVADSRSKPPGLDILKSEYPDIRIYLGAFEESLFINAQQIIISPGVSQQQPSIQNAIKKGIKIAGDIELFAQQVSAPVIAVTGSNGKSTVVSLLGEMAQAANIKVIVGGNIGIPILDVMRDECELYILELSSFQLESLQSLNPIAATVLNVSHDHMDRYNNFESYIKTKERIYNHCEAAVINRDDNKISMMGAAHHCVSGFTLNEPVHNDFGLREINNQQWLCQGNEPLIETASLKITGSYNLANALASLALGHAADIPMKYMLTALKAFNGLQHRTQWVSGKNKLSWINDSKGTNVGATLAAINGVPIKNKLILIAGGVAKNADFSPLKTALCEKARHVVLMGQDAADIEQTLQQCVAISYAKNMFEAVKIAATVAHTGDTVLLSPACASFDMFKNYEHRGEIFVEAIGKL